MHSTGRWLTAARQLGREESGGPGRQEAEQESTLSPCGEGGQLYPWLPEGKCCCQQTEAGDPSHLVSPTFFLRQYT